MRLSTTINFLIPPYVSSMQACVEELKRYKRLGFTCLDAILCGAHLPDSPFMNPDWKKWAESIREAAERTGITFVQSHTPFYNFCVQNDDLPDEMEQIVDRTIEAAAIFGTEYTVMHPATAFETGAVRKNSLQMNREYFLRRLECAARSDVGLALENMADFEGGGRKRQYCAWVEDLCELIDSLQGGDAVGACWDFGHANLVYPSQREALLYLGSRLKVTHTHDNGGHSDDHLSPFRGNVNWREVMTALADMGYERDLSFEVKRILNPDAGDEVIDSLWRHLHIVGECLLSLYEEARAAKTA